MHSRRKLFLARQLRELDQAAAESLGIAGYRLMRRAGQSAFRGLRQRWGELDAVVVVCGVGNNAGDGYVLAKQVLEAGLRCRVLYVGSRDKLKGDALRAAQAYRDAGGQEQPFDAERLGCADVIVDALLGIGVQRALDGVWKHAVEAINTAGVPVFSLDIPSGLNADSGRVMGACVRADCTLSFVGFKPGLFTGQGPAFCGEVAFDALGIPEGLYEKHTSHCELMDAKALQDALPRRRRDAHKRNFGRVLVVGGERGYGGAARMAGESALRVGAGLVSLAVREDYVSAMTGARPELMCHGVGRGEDLESLLRNADVVAVGPGLGKADWGRGLWEKAAASGKPLVVDADALNLLAEHPKKNDRWILTPHPGEAARLLGIGSAQVQEDRFAAVAALQKRYGGVIALKGAGTLVAAEGETTQVCPFGNPGMATAGMGDVLTGVIAGLMAQGIGRFDAARHGVLAHALAGDWAAEQGRRGMLASDVIAGLRRVVNSHAG